MTIRPPSAPVAGALLAAAALAGCATTVTDDVRMPAQEARLADISRLVVYPVKESRTRAVNHLATQELESSLAGVEDEGSAHFEILALSELGDVAEQQQIERGALRGVFDQSSVARLETKGVQALVLGSLDESVQDDSVDIKTKLGTKRCYRRTVTATLVPKFVSAADARILHADSYSGSASAESCLGAFDASDNAELAREARADAYAQALPALAPHVVRLDVPIISTFCKGGQEGFGWKQKLEREARGARCDPSEPPAEVVELVEGGVEWVKEKRLDRACENWTRAAALHREGFVTGYLEGVCAEIAEGDVEKAERLYRETERRVSAPVAPLNEALERLGTRAVAAAAAAPTVPAVPITSAAPAPRRKAAVDASLAIAQRMLNDAGYDAGPPDGLSGERTVTALRYYQEDYGLEVTGELDAATRAALGL